MPTASRQRKQGSRQTGPPAPGGPSAGGSSMLLTATDDEVDEVSPVKLDPAAQSGDFPSGSLCFSAEAALPGFSPPQMVRRQDMAIAWAFSAAVPGEVRRAVSIDEKNWKFMCAPLQWNYVCMHLAYHHGLNNMNNDYNSGVSYFMIQDQDGSEGLLLSIEAVRGCPPGLGLELEHFKDFGGAVVEVVDGNVAIGSGGSEHGQEPVKMNKIVGEDHEGKDLGPPPLFLVKYAHQTRGMGPEKMAKLQDEMNKWVGAGPRGGADFGKLTNIKQAVKSAAAIRYGFEVLKHNRRLLAPSERADEGEFFQKSVLFPPRLVALQKAHATYATVPPTAGNTTGNTNTSPQKTMSDGAKKRPSVVFDAKKNSMLVQYQAQLRAMGVPQPAGMSASTISNKTGQVQSAEDARGRTNVNIYGEGVEFVVKVQTPVDDPETGAWMVYDGPQRSFQCLLEGNMITAETKKNFVGRNSEAWKLVKKKGICHKFPDGAVGYKAFLKASWEGDNVRVFLDDVAPVQEW
eukprot:g6939.t1